MVELELFQRKEGAVALLRERQSAALELARLVERIARRDGLAQERACDDEHREDGEHGAEHEGNGHTGTAA